MSTKPAKLASNKNAPAQKVVREYVIRQEDGRFVARDVRTNRKITESVDREKCRHFAGFRHSYAPAVSS